MPSQTTNLQRFLTTEFITQAPSQYSRCLAQARGAHPLRRGRRSRIPFRPISAPGTSRISAFGWSMAISSCGSTRPTMSGSPAYSRLSDSSRSTPARPTAFITFPQFSSTWTSEIDRSVDPSLAQGPYRQRGPQGQDRISLFVRGNQDLQGDLSRQRAAARLAARRRDGLLAALGQAAGRHHRTRP